MLALLDHLELDRLSEIDTPTLMLAGAVDLLLRSNLRDFLRLPNATLEVLSRAGHEVAVHEPERVAAAIRAFMIHGPERRRRLTPGAHDGPTEGSHSDHGEIVSTS